MQILLASAKIMRESCRCGGLETTQPRFSDVAAGIASDMAKMSIQELSDLFGCSDKIAAVNKERYSVFGTGEAELVPAVFAYFGQAYKHLKADEMSLEDIQWACSHLWISSCMYGLLRPSDVISPYRMDGSFALPSTSGKKVSDFWKPLLTDLLIDSVLADDGVLIYLDTEEFRALFDWRKVESKLRVIEPVFHVMKAGKLTTPAVWAKTCRGAMARYIIENRLTAPEPLTAFNANGFINDYHLSSPDHPVFIR